MVFHSTEKHSLVHVLEATVHLHLVKRHLTPHPEGRARRRVPRGEVAVAVHRAVALAAVTDSELTHGARVTPLRPDQPLVAAGGRDAVGLCWVGEKTEEPTSGNALSPAREVVHDKAERKRVTAAARHVARVKCEV